MWKKKYIKLVTTEKRRNCLVSEPNYHTTKFFTGNLLAIEIKQTQIPKNKTAHLGLSKLESSKIVMWEFWYNYVKTKISKKSKILLHGYREFHYLQKKKKTWYL